MEVGLITRLESIDTDSGMLEKRFTFSIDKKSNISFYIR